MTEPEYVIRNAEEPDLAVLTDIKSPIALHRDRLRDADGKGLLYLVVEKAGSVIGFGLLVIVRPATWPDTDDTTKLPGMCDLLIKQDCRGLGAGTFLIKWMEETARAMGYSQMNVGVDPVDNKRAHQLYSRLGYSPIQSEPYRQHVQFKDSDGANHEYEAWHIDMVKYLTNEAPNQSLQGTR